MLYLFSNFRITNQVYFWGFAEKVLRAISAPISVIFIANYLDLKSQGFLYMFVSLISVKFLLELGLTQIIITFIAYEKNNFRRLNYFFKGINHHYIRFKEISLYTFKWFAYSSVIHFLLVISIGFYFFSSSDVSVSFWAYPLLILSILSSIEIALIPLYAVKEGLSDLEEVYKFKFYKALSFISSFVILLFLGYGIWSYPLAMIPIFIIDVLFIIKNRILIAICLRNKKKSLIKKFSWIKEMFNLQLRTAFGAVSGFVTFSLIVPYTFALLGPEQAGQVGLTIAITSGITNLSVLPSVINTQKISSLVEQKKIKESYILLRKLLLFMFSIHFVSLIALTFIYYLLLSYNSEIINKALSPQIFLMYFFAYMFSVGFMPLTIFMRSHKEEPLMWLSVFTGLTVSIGVYSATLIYGVFGGALAFLLTFSIALPILLNIYFNYTRRYL